jgi:glycerophosphoryl diester phosphodiesterase
MHDETVDRTTDGTGKIEEMTLEQFKSLDAGYDWTVDGGQTYPYRGQGITGATLEELFQALPDMPMTIEIKLVEDQPVARLFCDMIRQYGMQDKVLVASFHQDAMNEFRATCSEVSTSTTQNEVINFFARQLLGLGGTYSPTGKALQVPEYQGSLRVLSPRFIAAARDRGLDVHVWTVNDPTDMQRMVDLGVDGIVTDNPDRLIQLMGR